MPHRVDFRKKSCLLTQTQACDVTDRTRDRQTDDKVVLIRERLPGPPREGGSRGKCPGARGPKGARRALSKKT